MSTENGVSKKLCVTVAGIAAVASLAEGAENKLFFALAIAGMCVIFKIVQGFIDWKSSKE